MTEPTDNDLDVLLAEHWPAFATVGTHPLQWMRAAMRDAIAKWGTPPAVAGEPVAWWIPKAEQFCLADKSGDRPFAKAWEPLYTTPQPTQAQAGAVPLTDEQIREAIKAFKVSENLMGVNHIHVARAIERAHGIKGGQHGTDT